MGHALTGFAGFTVPTCSDGCAQMVQFWASGNAGARRSRRLGRRAGCRIWARAVLTRTTLCPRPSPSPSSSRTGTPHSDAVTDLVEFADRGHSPHHRLRLARGGRRLPGLADQARLVGRRLGSGMFACRGRAARLTYGQRPSACRRRVRPAGGLAQVPRRLAGIRLRARPPRPGTAPGSGRRTARCRHGALRPRQALSSDTLTSTRHSVWFPQA